MLFQVSQPLLTTLLFMLPLFFYCNFVWLIHSLYKIKLNYQFLQAAFLTFDFYTLCCIVSLSIPIVPCSHIWQLSLRNLNLAQVPNFKTWVTSSVPSYDLCKFPTPPSGLYCLYFWIHTDSWVLLLSRKPNSSHLMCSTKSSITLII